MELTEIVPVPAVGRVFRRTHRPGLADAAPSGRIRLDGLARWVQDIAYADIEDAGVESESVWVVRRMRIRVKSFPRFGETVAALTFCSGVGRLWAERRVDFQTESGRVEITTPLIGSRSRRHSATRARWTPRSSSASRRSRGLRACCAPPTARRGSPRSTVACMPQLSSGSASCMDEKQRERLREAVEQKKEEASATAHEEQLNDTDESPDSVDPRTKSTGHGKKTADKWNQ